MILVSHILSLAQRVHTQKRMRCFPRSLNPVLCPLLCLLLPNPLYFADTFYSCQSLAEGTESRSLESLVLKCGSTRLWWFALCFDTCFRMKRMPCVRLDWSRSCRCQRCFFECVCRLWVCQGQVAIRSACGFRSRVLSLDLGFQIFSKLNVHGSDKINWKFCTCILHNRINIVCLF